MAARPPETSERIIGGRYRLERELAGGGMGTVWQARDEVLERRVAVKLLNENLARDARATERFRREALTAASISHPRMANVFDYVEDDARPGIVMELVEGETLSERLARDTPVGVREAVRIAVDVLEALEAAHTRGIVHRDVKPGNHEALLEALDTFRRALRDAPAGPPGR